MQDRSACLHRSAKKRFPEISDRGRINIAAAGLGDTAALRFRRGATVLKASRSKVNGQEASDLKAASDWNVPNNAVRPVPLIL
jgi:hypothetical protein